MTSDNSEHELIKVALKKVGLNENMFAPAFRMGFKAARQISADEIERLNAIKITAESVMEYETVKRLTHSLDTALAAEKVLRDHMETLALGDDLTAKYAAITIQKVDAIRKERP